MGSFPLCHADHVRMAVHMMTRGGPGCASEEARWRVREAARLYGVELPPGWGPERPVPLRVVMHDR